jgi:hypothetical protein
MQKTKDQSYSTSESHQNDPKKNEDGKPSFIIELDGRFYREG